MRRLDPPPTVEESIAQMRRWVETNWGLELARQNMPPGTTLDEVRDFLRQVLQAERQPSRCMRGSES